MQLDLRESWEGKRKEGTGLEKEEHGGREERKEEHRNGGRGQKGKESEREMGRTGKKRNRLMDIHVRTVQLRAHSVSEEGRGGREGVGGEEWEGRSGRGWEGVGGEEQEERSGREEVGGKGWEGRREGVGGGREGWKIRKGLLQHTCRCPREGEEGMQ